MKKKLRGGGKIMCGILILNKSCKIYERVEDFQRSKNPCFGFFYSRNFFEVYSFFFWKIARRDSVYYLIDDNKKERRIKEDDCGYGIYNPAIEYKNWKEFDEAKGGEKNK